MSFGLRVLNDSDYLQIDSDLPRLCALYNGTYAASGSDSATITFPNPITTVEPPCVFIRNSPSQPNVLYRETRINGSSGNWRGFTIKASNVTYRPAGKWFVAIFGSIITNTSFGLRLFDESGSIIYDSGATPVIVTKASNTWSYVGTTQIGAANAYYYRSGAIGAIEEDEYYMINPLSRGVLAPGQQLSNWFGTRFNYSINRLEGYSVGFTGWTDIGDMATVFARLPGT